MTGKRKTQADREREREDAIERQEFMLSGGHKGSSKTAADLPDEIARAAPGKTFKIVGIIILIFLIGAFIYSLRSQHSLLVNETPVSTESAPE